MEKFKNIVKLLNEHLSLFITFPAVLGGLWQLISLMAIDPAYIRFFSATQMLADGLFVALVLLSFLLPIMILLFLDQMSNGKQPERQQNFDDAEPVRGKPILGLILLLVTLIMVYCSFILIKNFLVSDLDIYSFMYLPLIMLVNIVTIVLLILSILAFLKRPLTFKNASAINIFIYGIVLGFYINIIGEKFNRAFLIPHDLSNANNVLLSNPNCKIVYFNDTYIFLENKYPNKNLIKVIKFDDFFENNKAAD